jgi:hypothetical protein
LEEAGKKAATKGNPRTPRIKLLFFKRKRKTGTETGFPKQNSWMCVY